MMQPPSLKARIEQALRKRFNDPAMPELAQFVSGVNDAGGQGGIDDGTYGDPSQDTRPDFITKDNENWRVVGRREP